jgi:branched-chain amino acid transport system ATP-binding protein
MESIQCLRLSKSFDGVQALAALDLSLPHSGMVAIIGPNGAGKTTLINILTGFLEPDTGQCFLGGKEITALQPHQITRFGIARTFQELRLIFQLSALENVMLARPNQRGEGLIRALLRIGIAREEETNRTEAKRLLHFVGLEKNTNDLAGELSYGQQKLVALASCLATGARILFLDEPVAGVHPEIASRILELLRKIREDGRLIVFIEHDISAVRQVADIVIVMDQGRIIAQGIPSEVLERPEIMEAYLA